MQKIYQYFLVIFGIYLIALFGLLRADVLFLDDWRRNFAQEITYNDFSRYFSTFLSRAFNLFGGQLDFSPLSQIIAIAIMCACGLALNQILRNKIDIWGILASLPLGLSPYFLQNLSYKFDAPMMAASAAFAIIPFLFLKRELLFLLVSILCLNLLYITYQAANGIYLVLLAYCFIAKFCIDSHKKAFLILIFGALAYIEATILFKLSIAFEFSGYVSSNAFQLSELFSGILGNIKAYTLAIYGDFSQLFIFKFFIFGLILFIIFFSLNAKNRTLGLISAILFLIFGFILSYGAFLVLIKPSFEPRQFMGFGAFCAVILIALLECTPKWKFTKILACVNIAFIAYFCILFANIYANALKKQDSYAQWRFYALASDLADIVKPDSPIVFSPKLGITHHSEFFIQNYGNLAMRLMPRNLYSNIYGINGVGLFAQFLLQNHKLNCHEINMDNVSQHEHKFNLIKENEYHKIYNYKDCYIGMLKPNQAINVDFLGKMPAFYIEKERIEEF